MLGYLIEKIGFEFGYCIERICRDFFVEYFIRFVVLVFFLCNFLEFIFFCECFEYGSFFFVIF